MTFTEMVAEVSDDLNLRGPETLRTIGQKVNARYRFVLGELGMNVYTRIEFDYDLEAGTQDQQYAGDAPTVSRIVAIFWTPTATEAVPNPRPTMLDEITYEEMKSVVPTTASQPTQWCKTRVGSDFTLFKIDSTIPDGCTVTIEGEEVLTMLEDEAEPQWESMYHDILVFGAKSDMLMKQKDAQSQAAAKRWQAEFDSMLGKLRLRQTLMAGGIIKQGKNSTEFGNRIRRRANSTPWVG